MLDEAFACEISSLSNMTKYRPPIYPKLTPLHQHSNNVDKRKIVNYLYVLKGQVHGVMRWASLQMDQCDKKDKSSSRQHIKYFWKALEARFTTCACCYPLVFNVCFHFLLFDAYLLFCLLRWYICSLQKLCRVWRPFLLTKPNIWKLKITLKGLLYRTPSWEPQIQRSATCRLSSDLDLTKIQINFHL